MGLASHPRVVMRTALRPLTPGVRTRVRGRRTFSSGPAAAETPAESENFFQRNRWTIFLTGAFGSIGGYVYRQSTNTANHTTLTAEIEGRAALVPSEIRDLRLANGLFGRETFESISRSLVVAFPGGRATYDEFGAHIQGYLDAPLVGRHLIDRAFLACVSNPAAAAKTADSDALDVRLLMTLLSLAMRTDTVEDRTTAMHCLLVSTGGGGGGGEARHEVAVERSAVAELVGFLRDTSQVPPEKLVREGDEKYPFQTYREATPAELVEKAVTEAKLPADVEVTPEVLKEILVSRAVCAWGSCASRRRS